MFYNNKNWAKIPTVASANRKRESIRVDAAPVVPEPEPVFVAAALPAVAVPEVEAEPPEPGSVLQIQSTHPSQHPLNTGTRRQGVGAKKNGDIGSKK